MAIDLDTDATQKLMEEGQAFADTLHTESLGNIQAAHNITRTAASLKFKEVDALEAAAAEVVMRIKP